MSVLYMQYTNVTPSNTSQEIFWT